MLALGSLTSTVGCAKIGELKARKAFKAANQAYQAQDYKKAADLYEEDDRCRPESAQSRLLLPREQLRQSVQAQQEGRGGQRRLLRRRSRITRRPPRSSPRRTDPTTRTSASCRCEYLVAAYGADKLNDPAKAEPVVQKMIQLEPGEPTNYFALAKIYEDAGAYDEAEKMLLKAKEAKPSDPAVYMTLAGYYNRQGQFDKTIEALQERAAKEPNNPEAFYTIATYYWDKALPRLQVEGKRKEGTSSSKGVEAVDKALQIKPDYIDALVYKNLLLRLQANMEKDPAKQQALIKEADELRDKAEELRKQKAAGVS